VSARRKTAETIFGESVEKWFLQWNQMLSMIAFHKISNRPVISLFLLSCKITGREFAHSSVIGDALTAFTHSGTTGVGTVAIF